VISPDRLTRMFRALAAEVGLPPVRLHDLRHGAATLALAAGVDLRTVQDMLGYSSIVLTADTYTSVLPDVARAAGAEPGLDKHGQATASPQQSRQP